MSLTPADRTLLQRCLRQDQTAWREFVDRFVGLIYHVIHYTSHQHSQGLRPEEVEDLAADIMAQFIAKDFAILRRFKGNSSLAAYLTVVARRIAVHKLAERAAGRKKMKAQAQEAARAAQAEEPPKARAGAESLEEVLLLLGKLPAREREVVRMFYMEGRTYEEISTELAIPVNSIGPILSRARSRLRQHAPKT